MAGCFYARQLHDQADKAYVQNKMLNNAAEIWKWLDAEGAHFFVCDDARRMDKDVDAALRKIAGIRRQDRTANKRVRRKAQERQALQMRRVLSCFSLAKRCRGASVELFFSNEGGVTRCA
jgi:hypothetical protein